MKNEIRTRIIVCPSCNGRGCIDNPERMSTSATITCPACDGQKTIIETVEVGK